MSKFVPKFLYICTIFTVFLLQYVSLSSQDLNFEDFKKQYSASYQNYQDSVNQAFEGFLKAAWIEIAAQKPTASYKKPKPISLPVAKPLPEGYAKPKPKNKPSNEQKEAAVPPTPEVLSPKPIKAPVAEPPSSSYGLVFFGKFWEISFLQSINYAANEATTYSDSYFSDQWKLLETTYDAEKIKQIKDLLKQQNASDWSSFLFIQQWINEQKTIPNSSRDLHLWFLMQQLGYDFRIGYANNKSLVLAAFDQSLYGVTFYNFGDKKYYVVQNTKNITGRIKTYDGVIGKELRWMQQVPYTALDNQANEERLLKFPFNGEDYEFRVAINPAHIAYQEQFLRSKPELYGWFNPSDVVIKQLDSAIKPVLSTLTDEEQINFLLALVQYSFVYQTDDEQFGFEKFMTPEECLWSAASDCEDRTALFAWLVNRYTEHDYQFVRYPTHIALAISKKEIDFKKSKYDAYVDGDNNRTYVVADPTYVGASFGMEMPKLINKGTLIHNH